MSRQERSARAAAPVSADPVSGEYVTNWRSLVGIGAIVVLLAAGLGSLWWLDSGASPTPSARSANNDKQVLEPPSFRDLQSRAPTFRRSRWEADEVPTLDLTRQLWYGAARKTLGHSFQASLSALAQWGRAQARALPALPGPQEKLTQPGLEELSSELAQLTSSVDTSPDYASPRRTPLDLARSGRARNHSLSRNPTIEDAMLEYLAEEVPTLDVEQVEGTTKRFLELSAANTDKDVDPHAQMLEKLAAERTDMQGLPLLLGSACTSEKTVAQSRQKLALDLRDSKLLNSRQPVDLDLEYYRDYQLHQGDFHRFAQAVSADLSKKTTWQTGEKVAILEQLFQTESLTHRLLLVEFLGKIAGAEAAQALARRALFDMNEDVRASARQKLADRERSDEFASTISRGLNYPWLPVVDRSALALAETNRHAGASRPAKASELAASLAPLASTGSHVSKPYQTQDDRWVVNELVKVNHLRNCVLCHAASRSSDDPLRGQIPTPGRPLPRIYYSSNHGNFVRADIVYVRQDFSVMLPVKDPGPWPGLQRFDFFVRTRPATGEELQAGGAGKLRSSPLFVALAQEELTRFLGQAARFAGGLLAKMKRVNNEQS
jgi:hypothetical protein